MKQEKNNQSAAGKILNELSKDMLLTLASLIVQAIQAFLKKKKLKNLKFPVTQGRLKVISCPKLNIDHDATIHFT